MMKIKLKRIEFEDDTLELIWKFGAILYSRTVNAADVDTKPKLVAYILSQLVQGDDIEEYTFDTHEAAGAFILDGFTIDDAKAGFQNLPNWATWTGQEAADFVHGAVLGGMDKTQVDAYIDANATDLPSAKDVLKLLAEEVINLRNIVEKSSQAIMYLRDITIER